MDISNVNSISFDFDGVFLRHLLNRHWVAASVLKDEDEFTHSTIRNKIYIFIHKLFVALRTEIKGSQKVLSALSSKTLALTTSRRPLVKDLTINWLKKHNIYNLFSETYFNTYDLAPHVFKERILRERNFDMHVDDDYDTLLELVEKLPNVQFVYFNTMNTDKIDAPNLVEVSDWNELEIYFRKIGLIETN